MNEDDENGLVLSFDGPNNRKKYFDSDAVSCKANLSNLTSNEKDTIANSSARTIVEFNQLKPVRRLVQFIKSEKPCFLSEIVRTDLHKPYLVIPKMRNRRIIAQHGAFIIFGLDRELGPTYSRDIKARRIVVAKEAKADIRHERFKLGIHAGILFPEIDRSANQIMRRFLS